MTAKLPDEIWGLIADLFTLPPGAVQVGRLASQVKNENTKALNALSLTCKQLRTTVLMRLVRHINLAGEFTPGPRDSQRVAALAWTLTSAHFKSLVGHVASLSLFWIPYYEDYTPLLDILDRCKSVRSLVIYFYHQSKTTVLPPNLSLFHSINALGHLTCLGLDFTHVQERFERHYKETIFTPDFYLPQLKHLYLGRIDQLPASFSSTQVPALEHLYLKDTLGINSLLRSLGRTGRLQHLELEWSREQDLYRGPHERYSIASIPPELQVCLREVHIVVEGVSANIEQDFFMRTADFHHMETIYTTHRVNFQLIPCLPQTVHIFGAPCTTSAELKLLNNCLGQLVASRRLEVIDLMGKLGSGMSRRINRNGVTHWITLYNEATRLRQLAEASSIEIRPHGWWDAWEESYRAYVARIMDKSEPQFAAIQKMIRES